ncbi:MAG: hypothetical protein P8X94_13430 [Woeseiaceae bacterium]|jgi:hypothetical protein
MKRKTLFLALAGFLSALSGAAIACEYVPGETKFLDYAYCRYPKEAIQVIDLPEDASWEQCVYLLEAFRPPQLLAVVRVRDGKEEHSINSRHNIGNPCYLTKSACDRALKAHEGGG